jgi:hypothetical protein
MSSSRKKLGDKEIASYILAGLDADLNPVVSGMAARTELLLLGELYTQLVN